MSPCAHAAPLDTPCARCGTLGCAQCLLADRERWCPSCQQRRPTPSWRASNASAPRRLWRFIWAVCSSPEPTGAALLELPLWRALAVPLAVTVQLATVHAACTMIFDPPSRWLSSFLVLTGIGAAYVATWVTLGPLEWLLLRALGAPARFTTPLKSAALSLTPLLFTGCVPLVGPFLGLPWMIGARVGLLRTMAPARALETVIAVAAPLVFVPLVLFALRYDVLFRR